MAAPTGLARGRQTSPRGERMAQVEIFRGHARRRWSDEDKRRLVAETLAAGGTVHGVAHRYGVNTSQLFTWRKQLRAEAERPAPTGTVPGFATVTIAPPAAWPAPAADAVPAGAPTSSGSIEIELPRGERVRIAGTVDPTTIATVLRVLGGR
jgi:transposase